MIQRLCANFNTKGLQKTSQLFVFVSALFTAQVQPLAYAEKADKLKPSVIEADRVTHNELNQSQVFEGNVVLTKGTLQIKANRVETRTDAQGYQTANATGAAGKPASYTQKRDGLDEMVEAEAMSLSFDNKSDTITLTDQAIVRRIAKGVVQDESRGAKIKYNNQTEFYEVQSGATSSAPAGRVRMVLAPRIVDTAAASAPK